MPLRSNNSIERIIINLYKALARMGITDLYRAFGECVETKNSDGWNRPILGDLYNRMVSAVKNGMYKDKHGTNLLLKALASAFVVMDDDDVYFFIGMEMLDSIQGVKLPSNWPSNWESHRGKNFVKRDMKKDLVR